MKKILFILSVSLFSLSLSAFKKDPGIDPNKKITNAFKADYPLVNDVRWELEGRIYVARFVNTNTERDQLAYYNEEGEFLGQVWSIKLNDTPSNIQQKILKGADASSIKNIYLFQPPDGYPKYYATIVSNGKQIFKQVNATGESFIISKKRVPAI
ncbi:MAG TPA: hypothetical protein VJ765_14730 [Chitinophagaceae bacterium]|nr:hypothetical protein [Chitinophagaceae bacterium]